MLDVFEEGVANKCITAVQIQRVVQENCFSPDFSIALLADHFQVSIAYMSLQFKKEMGENFLDYVWKLRLEKAKRLLQESDLSIDEISVAVGYVNTSSFRRKFKQETGSCLVHYGMALKCYSVQFFRGKLKKLQVDCCGCHAKAAAFWT